VQLGQQADIIEGYSASVVNAHDNSHDQEKLPWFINHVDAGRSQS